MYHRNRDEDKKIKRRPVVIESAEVCTLQPLMEQRLWLAVVEKAIDDLDLIEKITRKCGHDEHRKYRESAHDFLYSPLPAFRDWRVQVFGMAGLDPGTCFARCKPKTRGVRINPGEGRRKKW